MTARRALTQDRGDDRPEILVVEQIGDKRSLTPNGSLVCYEVPIARTGWMIYAPGQVPVEVNPQAPDHIRVYRGPEELFKPETLASFAGVAVVDEHPDPDEYPGGVTPETWRELSHGFCLHNVRRGQGMHEDCIVADLIITSTDLIKAINDNKREVSCGYDADYIPESPGVARQANIIGNHIALVERGRCGPRCAIGDQAPEIQPKGTNMTTRVIAKQAPKARAPYRVALRKLVQDAENLLEETTDPGNSDLAADLVPGGGGDQAIHVHLHTSGGPDGPGAPTPAATPGEGADEASGTGEGNPMEARIAALEQGHQQITAAIQELTRAVQGLAGGAPTGDEEGDPTELEQQPNGTTDADEEEEKAQRATVGDSAALATSYATLVSDIEILVPGFRTPTFDSKAKRAATVDSMCKLRRRVLDQCYATTPGQQLIDGVNGGVVNLDKMQCPQVAALFRAAVGAKRLINNRGATADANKLPNAHQPGAPERMTPAKLNEAYKDFWAKQGVPA